MIPIYLLYLAGSNTDNSKKLIINCIGFVIGFTITFMLLGATASLIGSFLSTNRVLLQRISGIVIILFGLNFMGIINIKFLNKSSESDVNVKNLKFFSSLLFGIVFSLSWTPCLGAFLGTALLLASNSDTLLQGMFLLFVFGIGLGIPFILAGILFNKLQNVFAVIKQNFKIINIISGSLLVITGLLLTFNLFNAFIKGF